MAMALLARRRDNDNVESFFGIKAAGRMMLEAVPPWVQDLGLLIESVESGRPAGAPTDWQPGAVVRLPYSQKICHGGLVGPQALLAAADTAMMFACAAAWSGYRPMSPVDQTMHFLRPVNFDVLAEARIVRIGRTTMFGRVTLSRASDKRPVGMVSGAYAML